MDRIFKAKDRYGNETEFELKEPTLLEERKAETQYRIAYTEAIKQGLLPREAMREALFKNKIWTEEDEKEFRSLVVEAAKIDLDLKDAEQKGNKKKCIELAVKLSKVRNRSLKLILIQQSVFINSCEGIAESVKEESLMASCVLNKVTKNKYWEDYKSYIVERDEHPESEVPEKMAELWLKIRTEEQKNITSQYPEFRWIENIRNWTVSDMVNENKDDVKKFVKRRVTNANKVETKTNKTKTNNRSRNKQGVDKSSN